MAIKCTILRVDICPFEHKLISYRYATVPKQTPPSFNFLLIKAMIVECLKTFTYFNPLLTYVYYRKRPLMIFTADKVIM